MFKGQFYKQFQASDDEIVTKLSTIEQNVNKIVDNLFSRFIKLRDSLLSQPKKIIFQNVISCRNKKLGTMRNHINGNVSLKGHL